MAAQSPREVQSRTGKTRQLATSWKMLKYMKKFYPCLRVYREHSLYPTQRMLAVPLALWQMATLTWLMLTSYPLMKISHMLPQPYLYWGKHCLQDYIHDSGDYYSHTQCCLWRKHPILWGSEWHYHWAGEQNTNVHLALTVLTDLYDTINQHDLAKNTVLFLVIQMRITLIFIKFQDCALRRFQASIWHEWPEVRFKVWFSIISWFLELFADAVISGEWGFWWLLGRHLFGERLCHGVVNTSGRYCSCAIERVLQCVSSIITAAQGLKDARGTGVYNMATTYKGMLTWWTEFWARV